MYRLIATTALTLGGLSASANADILKEVRGGVLAHNICISNCKNANKEDGVGIEGELVFASPDVFKYILSPRPFAVANVNSAGNTSFAGVGLQWDFEFADGWSIEPGIGYVIHDGETDPEFAPGDPAFLELSENTVLLGSRDLFRTSLALTRDFGDRWGAQIIYEHLSHGQILGDGRNQGLDSLGVRAIYRFSD